MSDRPGRLRAGLAAGLLILSLALPTSTVAQTTSDISTQSSGTVESTTASQAQPPAMAVPSPPDIAVLSPPASNTIGSAVRRGERYLRDGGPAIFAIALLSLVTMALIIWKVWRFSLAGAWSRRPSRRAVALWEAGKPEKALALVSTRRGLRSKLAAGAMHARTIMPEPAAREETQRLAKHLLAGQTPGLRALELISTVAPLLGLLGTVLGMIAAFQALQEAGSRADPALLAGGIWEALLTTAAGMAVAIPASAALTWFEAVIDNIRQDMEDMAARIFISPLPAPSEDPVGLAAQ